MASQGETHPRKHPASRSGDRLFILPADLLAWVAGAVIVVMMLHISVDAVSTFLFATPIAGTLETVSAYYMVAVVFLPLAYVTRSGSHITVELFTRRLRPRRRAALEAVVGAIGVVYMATFTWQTAVAALTSTRTGEEWETADDLITIWPSRWLPPVGYGLMMLYLLYRVFRDLRRARSAA